MSTSRALKGLAVATAGAVLTLGGAGLVNAQGTVIVNNAGMDVDVVNVDRATGTVTVTMTNNLGFTVYCETPTPDTANRFGGSVASAPVVEMSAEYYERFQNVKAEMVSITASGSTITMPLWPLEQFLPQGSLGAIAGDAVQLRSQISAANTKSKVDGLFGTTTAFALANGANTTRTITLGPAATQPRGEDKIGFFTICAHSTNSAGAQGAGQLYAWSAFEEGWPPPVVIPEEEGTLASGSLGSLGSSGAAPVDPEPPVDEGPPIVDGGDPLDP